MFKTVEALHDNITNESFYPLTHEQAVIDNDEVDLETKLKNINKDISSKVTDYSKQYLTTVALEQGTISFNIWKSMGTDMITSISYSVDGGKTWTKTNNVNNKTGNLQITVSVNNGDSVLWKGEAQQLGFYDADEKDNDVGSFFSSTASFNVLGNVMSMCYEDDFENEDKLKYYGQFCWLFSDFDGELECDAVDASKLSLPAITLSDSCYRSMFQGCTALTTAPELPATTLAEHCYSDMFSGCLALTVAPELPATTLVQSCYGGMFYCCTSLTTSPKLPATTLVKNCYQGMFMSCTSLTTAPKLPATTLAERCYSSMFVDCKALITAPELPATTLVSNCYSNMFHGCTSINYIKCLATNISASNCTNSWVNGVAATGTFIKADNPPTWGRGHDDIPTNWNVYSESEYKEVKKYELDDELNKYILELDYSKQYLTFTALQDTTFTFSTNALQYSLDDGTTWTTLAANTASPTVIAGNKILWKATLTPSDGCGTFSAIGNFEASGNIMSLLFGDNFIGQTDLTGKDTTFGGLFASNTKLVNAKNLILPATTLATYCYYYMFQNCTALATAPQLPATTLANSCYSNMFSGCTALTTAPQLPATTLANSCYSNMFSGCTALTTAPQLPATTLVNQCYGSMFSGCTSLTAAPQLPATTLVELCYSGMFSGCTMLNTITCFATDISPYFCIIGWVEGVSASGTFITADNPPAWTRNTNGIPTNWNVYTESEYKDVKKYEIVALEESIDAEFESTASILDIHNRKIIALETALGDVEAILQSI